MQEKDKINSAEKLLGIKKSKRLCSNQNVTMFFLSIINLLEVLFKLGHCFRNESSNRKNDKSQTEPAKHMCSLE